MFVYWLKAVCPPERRKLAERRAENINQYKRATTVQSKFQEILLVSTQWRSSMVPRLVRSACDREKLSNVLNGQS
jgi:hypothetical protein